MEQWVNFGVVPLLKFAGTGVKRKSEGKKTMPQTYRRSQTSRNAEDFIFIVALCVFALFILAYTGTIKISALPWPFTGLNPKLQAIFKVFV